MNTQMRKWGCFSCALATAFCFAIAPASADADANPAPNSDGVVSTYDDIDVAAVPPSDLRLQAREALMTNRVDRAIQLSELALKKDPNDLDNHCVYAQALEAKISSETSPSPDLVRRCVSEWVTVMRSAVGPEKGLAIRGPGFWSWLFRDSDHYGLAKTHLKDLVGTLPHPWETPKEYLARALQTKHELHGKILKHLTPEDSTRATP